jgi:hypothetical protein
MVGLLLSARQSLIVDSNFNPALARTSFLDLKERYLFESFEINCRTDSFAAGSTEI